MMGYTRRRFGLVFFLLAAIFANSAWAITAKVHKNKVGIFFNKLHRFRTYEMPLDGASKFFANGEGQLILQTWNQKYSAAQKIFAQDSDGEALRNIVHAAHDHLYSGGVHKTVKKELYTGD